MSKFASLELEVEKASRMTIVHPLTRQPIMNEAKETAYIDIYSADSEVARRHHRAVAKRRLAMRGRSKVSPEDLESESTDLLVVLTSGWNLMALDGSPIEVPFGQENARELYSKPTLAWIREQVDEWAADRANFSKPSSIS